MKYHGSVAGIAAIATTAVLAASSAASAATLSQQSVSLLSLDPTNSQYASSYSSIVDAYNSQAASHSLAFEDWFAINSFVNNEQAAYGSSGAKLNELVALDLNNLSWKADAQNVEVFFINEGAGYRNKFGYSTASPTAVGNEGLLAFWNDQVTTIWSDIASQNSIISESNGPLTLGQGYTIGDVAAGNTINFLLRNPQNKVFDSLSAANTKNGDGLQHVTTYQYGEYLVLAYEDIYNGGDQDYNDVVIAVKGLFDTADTADVPEPGSVLALLGLGLVGAVVKRKQLT